MSTVVSQKIKIKMELLQQVRVIDPWQQVDRLADILIGSGKILAIADRISDYPIEASIVAGSKIGFGNGIDRYLQPQWRTRKRS